MYTSISRKVSALLLLGLCLGPLYGRIPDNFELVPQVAHRFALNDIAHGPNNAFIASASYDRVLLWEIAAEQVVRVIADDNHGYACLAFSPDGKLLAVGARNQNITLWDIASGARIAVLEGHGYPVLDLAFNYDGSRLVSAASHLDRENETKQGEVKVWDVGAGVELFTLAEEEGAIEPVCFSPDGQTIAGGSLHHTLVLWDANNGNRVRTFSKFNLLLQAVAFSPDGTRLATSVSGMDQARFPARGLILWDVTDGRQIHTFSDYTPSVTALAFSPDGRHLVSAANDDAAYFFESRSQPGQAAAVDQSAAQKKKKKKDRSKKIRFGTFIKGATSIARGESVSESVKGIVADTTVAPVYPLNEHTAFKPKKKRSMSLKLRKSKGNKFIPQFIHFGQISVAGNNAEDPDHIEAVLKREDGGPKKCELRLWDTKTGTDAGILFEGSSPIYTLAFNREGSHLITDGEGGNIRRWGVADRQIHQSFKGVTLGSSELKYSPDGRYAFILDFKNNCRIWDTTNPSKMTMLRGHDGPVTTFSFSPDSKTIATADMGKSIRIWNLADFSLKRAIQGAKKHIGALCYSPDGQQLVSIGMPMGIFQRKGELRWWDVSSGSEIFKDKSRRIGRKNYQDGCFSPDGRYFLLNAGNDQLDGYADLWNVATGRLERTFAGGVATAFTPDSKYLITAGYKLVLWKTETGEQVREMVIPGSVKDPSFSQTASQSNEFQSIEKLRNAPLFGLSVSPDGRKLLSNHQNTFHVWDLDQGKLLFSQDRFTEAGFNGDGSIIMAGDLNGRVRLWALEEDNLRPLITMIGFTGSEDFIIYNEDLHYMSTRNGYEGIAIVKDNKAYSFELFDLVLNRPDLVLASIPGSDQGRIADFHHAAKKRLEKMGRSKEDIEALMSPDKAREVDNLRLPMIRISSDQNMEVSAPSMMMKLEAEDGDHSLDRFMVWVNDVPVYGREGKSIADLNTQKHELLAELALSPGRNKIQARVINAEGRASRQATHYVYCTAEMEPSKRYLLAIGVSDYMLHEDMFDLKYAAKDAEDLATVVETIRGSEPEQVVIKKLLNHDATRDNILEARSFLAQARVNDQVWVFVAGHGMLDDGDFYFGTADIDFSNPSETGLPYNKLEGLVDGISARQRLLLIDTCFSGEVDGKPGRVDTESDSSGGSRGFKKSNTRQQATKTVQDHFQLMQRLFVDLRRDSGAVVLTSASGREFAYEEEALENGVFTHALLQGLAPGRESAPPAADMNKDYRISVSELKRFVIKRVAEINSMQTPTTRRENLASDFVVAGYTRPPSKKKITKIENEWMLFAKAANGEMMDVIWGNRWNDKDKPDKVPGDWRWIMQTAKYRYIYGLETPDKEYSDAGL
ncbi:MAG: caspase family protein [Acidobacteriota bacterium]|nr:caspase family protein [Acidobacteriota bacterium]